MCLIIYWFKYAFNLLGILRFEVKERGNEKNDE